MIRLSARLLVCLCLGLAGAVANGAGFAAGPTPGADEEQAPAPRRAKPPRESYGPPPPTDAAPTLTRAERLDQLFTRLAAAADAEESNGLIGAIERLQLESGSDTGDLLMARAVAAIAAQDLTASLAILDKLVLLRPEWAEAWNKRATARYLAGDGSGSMADIAETLKREPRHIGALSGMGMILEQRGFRQGALRAYRRALDIAPQMPQARAAIERLKTALEGQGL